MRPIAVCKLKRVFCRDRICALPIRAGKIFNDKMPRFHVGQSLPEIATDQAERAPFEVLLPNGKLAEEGAPNECIVIGAQREVLVEPGSGVRVRPILERRANAGPRAEVFTQRDSRWRVIDRRNIRQRLNAAFGQRHSVDGKAQRDGRIGERGSRLACVDRIIAPIGAGHA